MSSGNSSNSDILLKLKLVSKNYLGETGLNNNVLKDISFEIPQSENGTITSILSPFGSGKSTLLKIISGLIKPSAGEVEYNSGQAKKIPYLPEKPSSFPWLNVKENIELALNISEDKKFSLEQLVSLVGLTGYENHYPNNKSIGFRFRISLARALAVNPFIILIDDSMKMIKKESRQEIYNLLIDLSSVKKQNFILATTNPVEAIQLSDKIILMRKNPAKIISEINIGIKDRNQLNDHKSEIFTALKSKIETAFETEESLSIINYSV